MELRDLRIWCVRWHFVFVLALVHCLGCSDQPETHPVEGQVVFDDGTPLVGGTVEFLTVTTDGKRINARGVIDDTGAFSLGTFSDRDGALEGEHQAIVVAPSPLQAGDVTKVTQKRGVDPTFGNYATSRLKFTVVRGENRFVITVTREG